MNVTLDKRNMDDLTSETVKLGRHSADRAQTLQLGENARDVAFVSRCFARLKDRQPFDRADEGGFEAVMGILENSIALECVGTTTRYEETGFDEFGPHGEARETPVHTERGDDLIILRSLFQRVSRQPRLRAGSTCGAPLLTGDNEQIEGKDSTSSGKAGRGVSRFTSKNL